jgi:hypothetical protein
MRRPFKNEERQIAMVLIVIIMERKLLLAIGGVIGMIKIKHNGGWGLCVTGEEMVHKSLTQPIEVFAVDMVLQTRERRGTG